MGMLGSCERCPDKDREIDWLRKQNDRLVGLLAEAKSPGATARVVVAEIAEEQTKRPTAARAKGGGRNFDPRQLMRIKAVTDPEKTNPPIVSGAASAREELRRAMNDDEQAG